MCLLPNPEVAVRVLELVAEGENDHSLHEIKIRTLIIYGNKEGESIIEKSQYLERILTDAELLVIKGAGYVPIVTRTHEVVDAIDKRFFNT